MLSDLAPRPPIDLLAARAARRARTDELADQIAVCAARIDAATHQLLALIRAFDREKGWAEQGSKSCAQWLSWRIGIGAEAAREKVRIALALEALPQIDAAFERAELSYTKVRAMTRVATPQNEDLLLAQARRTSGAELERICSGFRRVLRGRATDEERRYVRRRTLQDGSVQIELRLLPDEADLVWKAITAARDALRREGDPAGAAEATSSTVVSAETPAMRMPPVEATSSTVVSAETAKAPTKQMPAVSACPTAVVSAETPTMGMPAVDACPTAIVSAETAEAPSASEPASGVAPTTPGRAPGATLADGAVAMAEAWLAMGGRLAGRSGADRHTIFVHLGERDLSARSDNAGVSGITACGASASVITACSASAAGITACSSAASASASDAIARPWKAELFDGVALAGETLLRLACDGGLVAAKTDATGSVLDLGRRRRTVSPSLRRALLLRDRGCRFPGCRHRAFVDAHHIEHWAHGGMTALDNTVLLCHRHHVLLHEGGFGVRRDGGSLRFIDPDGRTLEPNPKPHPAPGALRALEVDHEARGIAIDARTALPRRPEQVEVAGCVRALAALHPWE